MKLIFFSLLAILFYPAHAQQPKKQKAQSRLSVGINFSPDYSFRTLKNDDGSSSADLVIKNRNDVETAKFGFTTGLNARIDFSKQFGFETGIQYSGKGYKTKNQDLLYLPPNPFLPVKARTVYSYHYIGIPLKARFTLGEGKARFISGIGFMTNFLLKARQATTFEYADGRKDKRSQASTSDFKAVDISSMLSLGIDYKINEKLNLVAEPVFRYGVLKTADNPVKEYLWNAGLNIVLYYGLK